MKKLIIPTLQTFLIGVVALGVVIFIPAWTLNYWQAWVFILVFTTCVNAVGLYLSVNDPALLERRKKFGPASEQNPVQKVIMLVTLIGVLALLVVPALDHRFGWSPVPARARPTPSPALTAGPVCGSRHNPAAATTPSSGDCRKTGSANIAHPAIA